MKLPNNHWYPHVHDDHKILLTRLILSNFEQEEEKAFLPLHDDVREPKDRLPYQILVMAELEAGIKGGVGRARQFSHKEWVLNFAAEDENESITSRELHPAWVLVEVTKCWMLRLFEANTRQLH